MNKIGILATFLFLPAIVNASTMNESGQPNSLNSPKKPSFTSTTKALSETSDTCYVVSEYYKGARRQKVVSNQIESRIIDHVNAKDLNLNDLGKGEELTGLEIEIDGHSVDLNVYRDLSGETSIAIVGDTENRLVFRLGFLSELSTNQQYKLNSVALSLERGMSKIDGITHALAFMDGEIDELTNTLTDDEQCRRELAKKQAKNQYWGAYIGPGLDSSNILDTLSPGICKRTVSMRTCYAKSPVKNVSKIKVPVFIIQGEEDVRVPKEHAFALRAELEKRNMPYEWMMKSGEGHGFYKPENNVERWDAMIKFLDKHTQ